MNHPLIKNPSAQVNERFWSKVQIDESGECWNWVAGKFAGYGRFMIKGKSCLAHRIAYELCIGEIPEGKVLDHICHNRACVNPRHLRPCTHSQNSQNRSLNRNSKSGHRGVLLTQAGTFCVHIAGSYVGTFKTLPEAVAAYSDAARARYGEFANLAGVA